MTLEQGTVTRDVAGDEGAASTTGFTDAIVANLGQRVAGLAGALRTGR